MRIRIARARTVRAVAMSRGAAKRRYTLADHAGQTAGVECRKDAGVLDEIPGAYKEHRCGDGRTGRARRCRVHLEASDVHQGLS